MLAMIITKKSLSNLGNARMSWCKNYLHSQPENKILPFSDYYK